MSEELIIPATEAVTEGGGINKYFKPGTFLIKVLSVEKCTQKYEKTIDNIVVSFPGLTFKFGDKDGKEITKNFFFSTATVKCPIEWAFSRFKAALGLDPTKQYAASQMMEKKVWGYFGLNKVIDIKTKGQIWKGNYQVEYAELIEFSNFKEGKDAVIPDGCSAEPTGDFVRFTERKLKEGESLSKGSKSGTPSAMPASEEASTSSEPSTMDEKW
jgi:hypothetical protein